MLDATLTVDMHSELHLISGILSDYRVWDVVGDRLIPDVFYAQAHRCIYDAAQKVASKGESVDYLSISRYLRDSRQVDAVGGELRLMELSESSAQHLIHDNRQYEQLCDRLTSCYQRRQLALALQTAVDRLKDSLHPLEEVLDEAEKRLIDVRRLSTVADESGLWQDITYRQLERINNQHTTGEVTKIQTQTLDDFDDMCEFQAGDLVGIMGAAGCGKTAFACGLAYDYAIAGSPVFFWSLEQPEDQLWARIQSADCGIDNAFLGRKRDRLTPEQIALINERYWSNIESPLPIYIHSRRDNHLAKFSDFELYLKRRNEKAPAILIVDHLQHLAGSEPDAILNWTVKLKDFAMTKNVLVLLLVQPADLSSRNDKRPTISDISYCKTAKQVFDVLIGMHREGYWDPSCPDPMAIDLDLLKHRHLPSGKCTITADFKTCRFKAAQKYDH